MRLPASLRQRTHAIPLADASAFRREGRRTLVVRLVLAGLLVGCLLAAFTLARDSSDARKTFFEARQSSVLVIDSSSSVDPSRRELVGRVLRKLENANSGFGIVFFSDTAFEAVPPNTPWTEVAPLLRFFHDAPPQQTDQFGNPIETRRSDPWTAFRGGTNISTGLRLARRILQREDSPNAGVLLMSDLDNSIFDQPKLMDTLTAYAAEGIPLRVLGLDAASEDKAYFATVLGRDALVTDAELAPRGGGGTASLVETAEPTPATLLGVSILLLLLLGANEHWAARLRWRERPQEQS